MRSVKNIHRSIFWRGLLLALVYLFNTSAVQAAGNFDKGLLWKIERSGSAPGYLFGTMHSDDPKITRLPPLVQDAFDQSAGVVLEITLSMDNLLYLTTAMMLPDGQNLQAITGDALYKQLVKAHASRGIPEMMLKNMKPWAAAVTLMMPATTTGIVLDQVLFQQATEKGKSVDGLETAAEQIGVFDALTEAQQVALLRDTLEHQDDIPKQLDELKEAWLARDLKWLVSVSDESMKNSDPALVKAFNQSIIVNRNHNMAHRMEPYLQKGNHFIAIGALHLPGEEGVLNLLQKRGYRVTVVY